MAISTRAGRGSRYSGMGLPEMRSLRRGLSAEGLNLREELRRKQMEKIYELQADICKIFSNAKRLEIINALKDRRDVGQRIDREDRSQQGQSFPAYERLEVEGSVLTRREGLNIYYRISNPKIIQACNLMREVLLEQLQEKGKMVSSLRLIR